MAIDYTTTALLEYTRTVCLTPEADALFDDTRLLSLLNGEQYSTLVPQLMSIQEEFFVNYEDLPITAGTTTYDIPERAVGLKLRDVALVDASGNIFFIGRVNASDAKFATPILTPIMDTTVQFFLRDTQVILLPTAPVQYASLRLYFYRRPSSLVVEADAGQITVIDTVTHTVTVSAAPATFVATATVDFIKGRPSFRSLEDDRAIASVSNNDITFSAALPTGLAVGDWIALSGETPIPQIPYEVFPLLGQLGACKALEAMGDPAVETAWGRYKQMREDAFKLLSPRTDAPPVKVKSPNNIFRGTYGGWR